MYKRRGIDVMISPNMTSFIRTTAGRWFPFHRQPAGKAFGQVELISWSLESISENIIKSKSEYTNTQQD